MKILEKREVYSMNLSGKMSKELYDIYLLQEKRRYFIHVFNEKGHKIEGFTTCIRQKAHDMYTHMKLDYRKSLHV